MPEMMSSCYDCNQAKVVLPVHYGEIKYTGAEITMKCGKGLWEDEKEGNSSEYRRNNLKVITRQLSTPSVQGYFDRCAERLLNGEEHLNNID